VSYDQLLHATIQVSGSRSGVHSGRLMADSDGRGGSFMPFTRFTPGELVTVATSLNVAGASNGTYQFTVAIPAGGIPYTRWPNAARVPNDVRRFHSRLDLAPSAVQVLKRGRGTAAGDIFVAPQFGPVQDGPMIVDSSGGLVWFQRLPHTESASDFRAQRYQGKPVLTWWEGYVTAGVGVGNDVIFNSSYQQIATVRAANGLSADLHDFEITPQGTAFLTAYYPVRWDASSIRHGRKNQIVLDSVVQEIDIPTGLVLFQWDSLDHVPVSDTFQAPPPNTPQYARAPFNYFHVNAVQIDSDATLLISARNTWALYKVNPQTGSIIWTLGGKRSSFRMGRGASFAWQHDVRVRSRGDTFVTLFDDGAGPPVHDQSRGLKLKLDLKHMTARVSVQYKHSPPLLATFEGNAQQLPNLDLFIGWGAEPYFSEYNARGRLIFDARFVDGNASYSAFRLPWAGTPAVPPAAAVSGRGRNTTVYASWNGATAVAGWRVLTGRTATALRPARAVRKQGFETAIKVGLRRYFAVQALDARGRVIGVSRAMRS
jgi:hypothetical protein